MTIAAAKEIEQSANRGWRFWKSSVVQQLPDYGVRVLNIERGVTILPNRQRQVVVWFDTEEMRPTLEGIQDNPEWKSQDE